MLRATSRLSLLSLAAVLAACAVNPATGKRELALIGQGQEIAMGREADGQISESLGLVDDPELQRYVSDLGLRLAAVSERPDLPWSFKVVDDAAVNAFALPGGFIYVTRGILAHFDSEAELVGVLGHEIGHVTARHSVTQMSRQQVQQIGLGVGMILSEDVRKYGGLLSTGLGLINLRYSRGDETESDELGARYMTRVGYDANALTGVFRMLAGVSGGGGRAPEWQLTHPHPENREARIRQVVDGLGAKPTLDDGRNRYLERIQGMTFGENPREGYFRGALFLHPDLEFQIRFPEGWRTVNQRAAVAAVGPGGDALVILEIAQAQSDAASALRAFLATDGVTGGPTTQGTSGAGLRFAAAGFALASGADTLRGQATFVEHGGRIYRILGMASRGKWTDAMARTVGIAPGSFAPLTDRAVLAVRPWTLQIVPVLETMTLEEFHRRHPTPIPLDQAALLNRRDPRDTIPAGTRMKQVVGERWR